MKSINFNNIQYPVNHWAHRYPQKTDRGFICKFNYSKNEYTVCLNSTDSRGYRSIVSLVVAFPGMKTTFNRPYNLSEKVGLQLSLTVVAHAYEKLNLVGQVEIAGNNSHLFENDQLTLGTIKEPSLLHGHIIGRGDPNFEYVLGVPLRGPKPGELFNMRGNDLTTPGNDKKTPWILTEIDLVSSAILAKIRHVWALEPILNLDLME